MHSSRRSGRPDILAYSVLSGAARPLALTACVKCLNMSENGGVGLDWRQRDSSVCISPSQNVTPSTQRSTRYVKTTLAPPTEKLRYNEIDKNISSAYEN